MVFHGFEKVKGPECLAARAALWRPVASCRAELDPPNIKISDSGGLDLESWCLDGWMLEGLKWIGGGDGGDGGDWNGRRGLEEIPTRSSFRSSADLVCLDSYCPSFASFRNIFDENIFFVPPMAGHIAPGTAAAF